MPTSKYDFVVVGGGIVGCSTAFYLSKQDVHVAILEKREIGSGASGSGAGILTDSMFYGDDLNYCEMDSFSRLNRAGYDFYPTFLQDLGNSINANVGYRNRGGYYLAFDDDRLEDLQNIFEELTSYDRPVRWLDPGEIEKRIPVISSAILGGFYYECERQVSPDLLMDALASACNNEGVALFEHSEVEDIRLDRDSHVEVMTNQRSFRAETVLIAAGAWTGPLTEGLPWSVPVSPRKGQIIRLRDPRLESVPLIHFDDRYIVPRRGHEALIGSSMHPDAGFDEEPTESDTELLLDAINQMIEGINRDHIIDTWAGLRPYAHKKGGPFMDSPVEDRLYVCAGHYRNGITQGPISGMLMADWMIGNEPIFDLEDYRIDR